MIETVAYETLTVQFKGDGLLVLEAITSKKITNVKSQKYHVFNAPKYFATEPRLPEIRNHGSALLTMDGDKNIQNSFNL